MKMKSMYVTVLGAIGLLGARQVLAVCPLCAVAVGAGIGLSRWLGIDDTITGLWIGGLIVSMILWTEELLQKKRIRFFGRSVITTAGYYALVVIPLYSMGMIGHPLNTIGPWRTDKLVFGIIAGSVAFWAGARWYAHLKEKNNGHAHFPFQKIVMPIAPLIVLSIVFYLFTK